MRNQPLSTQQKEFLQILHERFNGHVKDRTGRAVAKVMPVASGTMTSMDERGLITRKINGRRTLEIRLTNEGRRIAESPYAGLDGSMAVIEYLRRHGGEVADDSQQGVVGVMVDVTDIPNHAIGSGIRKLAARGVIERKIRGNAIGWVRLLDTDTYPLIDSAPPEEPELEDDVIALPDPQDLTPEPVPELAPVEAPSDNNTIEQLAYTLLDQVVERATRESRQAAIVQSTARELNQTQTMLRAAQERIGDLENDLDKANRRLGEVNEENTGLRNTVDVLQQRLKGHGPTRLKAESVEKLQDLMRELPVG